MAVAMELLTFLVMVVSLDLQSATAQGVPPPPSFTIMVVSPMSIKISWQNDMVVSRYGVNGYKVSYERVTAAVQQGPCPFHGHNETLMLDIVDMEYGIILPGLKEFSTYTIHITARNDVGYSAPSIKNFTTAQAVPSSAPEWLNSTATASTTITIQWGAVPCMDQNSEITGYKVRYGPVGSSQRATDTVTGSASTGGMNALTGLIPFSNYSIEVAAVNSNGDTGPYTHPILTATTNITSSPENILLEAITATEILVSWSALELPGWNVSQYTIYYTTVPINSQVRPLTEYDVPGNTTSATVVISNVTLDLIHQFQVSSSLEIEGVVYEGPKSEKRSITFNLTVTILVTYNPPADFIQLNRNEYRAASGPVVATCSVQGATGTVSYQWSSTCRHCPFQSTNKPQSTGNELRRGALHSGDTGTHTCTVNDGNGSAGTASIVMNVVGAGIHVFDGNLFQQPQSLTNNGFIGFGDDDNYQFRFRFFCRSDSMVENVGELIGLDGKTAITSNSFFNIDNPQPGELSVNNTFDLQTSLPASEQGVYTCRIPLDSGEQREINIGIYSSGFNTRPSINNCLVFSPGSSSSTLTCTSTGSPATTVTWTRNGQPLNIDGNIYRLTQTVINRLKSTYENVLTINDQLSNTLGHTYRCRVANALGSTSEDLTTTTPPVPECSAEQLSPTSIKLSWSRLPECRVGFFRIAWSTALMQPKPCSKLVESGGVDVESDVMEYIVTELEIFHSYTINVTAGNTIGNSTCSQNITTLPAPPSSAPEWVDGTAAASTTITIQWGAVPCMDQNSEITGYKVRYGPVGSSQRATDAVTGSARTGGMYTLTGLIPFTNYSIEVAAVNSNGETGPYTHPYFAETLISSPANVSFETVNASAVKVSWTKLQLPHWNLSHYTVYYTATKQGRAIDEYHTIISNPTAQSTVVVLRNLMPDLVHQFQISCSLNTERGLVEGPRSINRRFAFDRELFQLQIGPVEHCITWQPSKAEKMDAIIHHALAEAISCQCNCTFPHDFVRRGKFSCQNTTTKVSYRSTIVGTTTHNASQLVNFIQKWVISGPILEVEWWLLHINANCPVHISSLNDSECQGSRPVACNPTMMIGDPILFKCVQQNE